jgi:hypothetical protein
VGAELFHACGWADGQTGMTKLIVAFRNVANVPKMGAIKTLEVEKEQLHTSIDRTSCDKMNLTNSFFFKEIPLRVNTVER